MPAGGKYTSTSDILCREYIGLSDGITIRLACEWPILCPMTTGIADCWLTIEESRGIARIWKSCDGLGNM